MPRPAGRRWQAAAAAASLLVHAAAAWLLLPPRAARPHPATPPAIEVELVEQRPEIKGAPAVQPAEPPPAPQAPTPPQAAAGTLPPPPPPAPPRQQDAAPGPPRRSSTVNLGNAGEDQEGLVVRGPNVVPPRPDAAIRNKPPAYPADAARRHAEGAVSLRVRVTENGVPAWVDVTGSSGDASLDRAARDAVALWRFQPARENGRPVAFDYEIAIRFNLGP